MTQLPLLTNVHTPIYAFYNVPQRRTDGRLGTPHSSKSLGDALLSCSGHNLYTIIIYLQQMHLA